MVETALGKVERGALKKLSESQASQFELQCKIEELRKSQEELERSRNVYAFLYDFAPVGYFTIDHAGVIKSVNLSGEKLLGEPNSRLVNEMFERFVAAEDCFVFTGFLQTVFTSQEKQTCRLRLAKPDQEALYVRIEAKMTNAGQECLAVLVDITEKKRAEQALAESEYNLAKAQEMTHVGSWSFDPDTGNVKASAELLRILHLRSEDTTHEAFARVVHPEDVDRVMYHLSLGIDHGRNYEIEHRLLFPDGTERWVYSIVEPMVNSAGKVIRLYGTTQDITSRKQAEAALQNKTNELQAIFDSISDSIMVYDQEGNVQHRNSIGSQFFSQSALHGKSCQEIFHPGQQSLPQDCPVERALKGERMDTSLTWEIGDQGTRYLDVTATPIRDALGEKNRALVFFRDVSEKRHQEMHLIQAEKMSSIGVLATGIAHEINNPLTSVAGFAEALQRRFRDEAGLQEDSRLDVFPRYLEMIISESYRCKGIIDHLLSFGRKSDGIPIKVDLNLIVREILELLHYHSSYKQVEVSTDLKPNLPRIHGDPSSLRQVCMNLLINAYQSIEENGCVKVITDQAEDLMVSLVIRDNGCGIDKKLVERIWEPFFTTKEVGQGVGLGLALTYDIVKRHGGDINLTSREGEGSQFTVLLPISPG